ncbi:hypothetical protein T09_11155 [Trichinella sp. T9]|nr:hypothetical protein T09_11155 [Trichinella sp. T9]
MMILPLSVQLTVGAQGIGVERTPFLPNAVLSSAHVTAFEENCSYRLLGHGPSIFEPLLTVSGSIEITAYFATVLSSGSTKLKQSNMKLLDQRRGLAESCQNEDLDDCDNKASFIAVEAAIILFENALQLDLDNNQIWKCIAHSGDILKKVGSLPMFSDRQCTKFKGHLFHNYWSNSFGTMHNTINN